MFLPYHLPNSIKSFLHLLHGTGVPFISTAFKPSSRTLTYLSFTPQLRKQDSNLFSPYFTWIFIILFTQQPSRGRTPLPQNTGLEPATPYFTWISSSTTFPGPKHSLTAPCNQSIKPHLILLIFLPLLVRHLSKNLKLRPKELSPPGVQFLPKLGRALCRCPIKVRISYLLTETLPKLHTPQHSLGPQLQDFVGGPFWVRQM